MFNLHCAFLTGFLLRTPSTTSIADLTQVSKSTTAAALTSQTFTRVDHINAAARPSMTKVELRLKGYSSTAGPDPSPPACRERRTTLATAVLPDRCRLQLLSASSFSPSTCGWTLDGTHSRDGYGPDRPPLDHPRTAPVSGAPTPERCLGRTPRCPVVLPHMLIGIMFFL